MTTLTTKKKRRAVAPAQCHNFSSGNLGGYRVRPMFVSHSSSSANALGVPAPCCSSTRGTEPNQVLNEIWILAILRERTIATN